MDEGEELDSSCQDIADYVRTLNRKLQGPVAHERDWKQVREWIEKWADMNVEECWSFLKTKSPDTEWDEFRPKAACWVHAAAGLWSITVALAEAAPHILEHSKVVQLQCDAYMAYQATEVIVWCAEWHVFKLWDRDTALRLQSMHKDRVLRKKEKVQKLRAEISAVEKERVQPHVGLAEASLETHCKQVAMSLVPGAEDSLFRETPPCDNLWRYLVGASPPEQRVEWQIGQRVQVRNGNDDPWVAGTITRPGAPPLVKRDGNRDSYEERDIQHFGLFGRTARPEDIPARLQELRTLLWDLQRVRGTPMRPGGRCAMLVDFLEAFNKATDDEWQRDAQLRDALDEAMRELSPEELSIVQGTAAQHLQVVALRSENKLNKAAHMADVVQEEHEKLVAAQVKLGILDDVSVGLGGSVKRDDGPGLRSLSDHLRGCGDFELAACADSAADRAESKLAMDNFWRAWRSLAHSLDGDEMQLAAGSAAVSALLPGSAPASIAPLDALMAVRILCRAGRIADALRWTHSLPSEEEEGWGRQADTELVRQVPSIQMPSCLDVARSLILRWCWYDALEPVVNGSTTTLQLAPSKRARMGVLVRALTPAMRGGLSEDEEMLISYLESREQGQYPEEDRLGMDMAVVSLFQRHKPAEIFRREQSTIRRAHATTAWHVNQYMQVPPSSLLAESITTELMVSTAPPVRRCLESDLSSVNRTMPVVDPGAPTEVLTPRRSTASPFPESPKDTTAPSPAAPSAWGDDSGALNLAAVTSMGALAAPSSRTAGPFSARGAATPMRMGATPYGIPSQDQVYEPADARIPQSTPRTRPAMGLPSPSGAMTGMGLSQAPVSKMQWMRQVASDTPGTPATPLTPQFGAPSPSPTPPRRAARGAVGMRPMKRSAAPPPKKSSRSALPVRATIGRAVGAGMHVLGSQAGEALELPAGVDPGLAASMPPPPAPTPLRPSRPPPTALPLNATAAGPPPSPSLGGLNAVRAAMTPSKQIVRSASKTVQGAFSSKPVAAPSTSGGTAMYGAPAASAAPISFGGGPPANSGVTFGGGIPASSGNMFGMQAGTPVLATPTPAATPSSAGNAFGGAPASTPNGDLFGGAPASTPSNGLFGGVPTSTPSSSGSVFGAPAATPSSGAIFGAGASTPTFSIGGSAATPSSGGLFGPPAATPSSGGFGGFNGFPGGVTTPGSTGGDDVVPVSPAPFGSIFGGK